MTDSSNDAGIANSFTDLMTSLAVIFILLMTAYLSNAFNEAQIVRSKVYDKLILQLKDYLVEGVKIESDPTDPLMFSIVVPEGLLNFRTNGSTISPEGTEFLSRFVPKFADAICNKEFRSDINTVLVEGHTDSTGSDELNLELSQRRSLAVVNKSIDILKADESVTPENVGFFVQVLTANGRGEQDLVMVNGKEDPEKSRRVVFKVRVKSTEQK